MWRFVSGASPPKKIRKTAEERLGTQRKYDRTARKRSFNPSWKLGHPWLDVLPGTEPGLSEPESSVTVSDSEADSGDGAPSTSGGRDCPGAVKLSQNITPEYMICTVCRTAGKVKPSVLAKNSFATGCQSYKLESIKIHEASYKHLQAKEIVKSIEAPEKRPANQILGTLLQEQTEKMCILFRTCHALAMKNRPFTDYVWQCELDRKKGIKTGDTYQNAESAKNFFKHISEIEREKLKKDIETAAFISVLSDGSTDSSIKEQELFYVRYVANGVPNVKFLASIHAEKPDAQSIYQALKKAATVYLKLSWETFVKKLVGLGCDGASVMTGHKAGLSALLKKESPPMTTIHCMAHRLELSFKDSSKGAAKSLHEKTFETLLMGLYYFYHRSAVNRASLVRCATVVKCQLLLPTRTGGTRWIGHVKRALTNMIKSFPALVMHMKQLTEAETPLSKNIQVNKARCLVKLLTAKDVLLYAHFMLDIADELSKVSLVMQMTKSSVADIHRVWTGSMAVIKKMKTSDGPNLRAIVGAESVHGYDLKGTDAAFLKARKALVDDLVKSLESRFDNTKKGVAKASRLTKLECWPLSSSPDIEDFGDGDVETTVTHYKPILDRANIDCDAALNEWTSLKALVYDEHEAQDIPKLDMEVISHKYGTRGQHTNIIAVLELLQTIPASSAEVERGFSQLKLVKTDIRSKLTEENLNILLSIKMLAAPIASFDPLPAVDHWRKTAVQPRRPRLRDDFKPPSRRQTQSVDVPVETVTETATQPEPNVDTALLNQNAASDDLPPSDSDSSGDELLNDELIEKYNYIAW